MKFITEDELRNIYRNNPFTEYRSEEGVRLTPGAKQFLSDKRIRIEDNQIVKNKQTENRKKEDMKQTKKIMTESKTAESEMAESEQKAFLAIRLAEAQFLQIGLELMEFNVLIAQEVFSLEQLLVLLRTEGGKIELSCNPCSGIQDENFSSNMDDCFEITGFHVQSENGKAIAKLHYLRCVLRDLEPKLSYKCKESINCIVNRLSQMICLAFGGNTCQKKN